MPIRVTCPKCMSRFNVSDKFAGREGPCPKCKAVIKIPDKNEEVILHAPESAGPKDSTGKLVLKPIRRSETVLTPVQIVLIAVTIVGFLMVAILMRQFYPDPKTIPLWVIPAILTGLAPACVLGAYTFLRAQESGAFVGRSLLYRVLVCSAIYAAAWLLMWAGYFAFGSVWGFGPWILASMMMLGIGSAAAVFGLDLDWIMGFVHYGLYFGCSLLLRFCAGVGFFPGTLDLPADLPPAAPGVDPGLGNIMSQIDLQPVWQMWIGG